MRKISKKSSVGTVLLAEKQKKGIPMKIERINSYNDPRFPEKLLLQHGCFLADGEPCAFDILSDHEAVVHYQGTGEFAELVDEFRFFARHITTFYNEAHEIVVKFPDEEIFSVAIQDIQPSQFYVDWDKIEAVRQFISTGSDIIVPVLRCGERYVALDGHTRLYWACMNGWETVRAVEDESGAYIWDFVQEAQKRKIFTPRDMELIAHSAYEEKWNQFCDQYFARSLPDWKSIPKIDAYPQA